MARILEAYDRLPRRERIPLVLKLHEAPRSFRLPRGVNVQEGFCPDAKMVPLYQGARALIFSSIYEGFGLPIVEAMSSGCPVITSDRGACAEVAGDAALLVDPFSVHSISDAMLRLLREENIVRDLTARGLKRADYFSWDRCAAAHAEVFRMAATRRA